MKIGTKMEMETEMYVISPHRVEDNPRCSYVCICIYIYIYIYIYYTYIHVCVYIYRERESEMYIVIHMYNLCIYIYIWYMYNSWAPLKTTATEMGTPQGIPPTPTPIIQKGGLFSIVAISNNS